MSNKILLVDDELDMRLLGSMVLHDAGYAVLTAGDASKAMRLMEEQSLGLIVLDLNLAGEDGLSLMGFLHCNQPSVPIILYTGMEHTDEEVAAMKQQGAHRYVRKGPMGDLLEAVRASFRN